jgi:poly-gamma-glutamate capsule biosynthesis protein CapA/YwtB (metallophosphatase superfamily)/outer membrane protein assembly factor BamB
MRCYLEISSRVSVRVSLCAMLIVVAVSGCAGAQATVPVTTATHGADDPSSTGVPSPTIGSVASPTATSTPPPLEPLEMSLAWRYPTNEMVWSLASADLDNDGREEMVAGSYDKHVYALDSNGALLWRYALGAAVYCLDIGDLDGDGVQEVVAGGDDNRVHALGPVGQLLWEWYVGSRVVSLRVADVDGDGEGEVVAGSWDGQLLLLEGDGTLGWSLLDEEGVSAVECADLDGGKCVGIVAAHRQGTVSLVGCEGDLRWSYATGGYVRELAVGDTDGEGDMEIVVGSADGWVYVLSAEGQLRWRAQVGDPVISVAVADADGDGRSEVVVGTGPHDPQVLMLSDRGERRWSFQTQKSVWSVHMADLDTDGVLEVLAGGDDGNVYVLDVYGRQRGSYQTSRRVHGLAAVEGQGGGLLDVLARSGNDIYLLSLAPSEAAAPALPGDGEPETVVEWTEPSASQALDEEGLIELVAVGDILLSRTVEERMEVFGSEYPFEVVANLLREADLAIGNLESPFSLGGDPLGKRFTFRTHPGHAEALDWAGFDVLSLANNHVLDFGEESLLQTMEALRAAGLAYVGAGASYEEAHRPLVMEVKGQRIAFLAYAASRWKGSYELPTEELVAFADPLTIGQDVARAKEQADLVVVILHLGTEYQAYPDEEQLAVARAAMGAGASLVLGHHPHVVQGSEEYAGGFVAYSLGNFVFDIDMESTREGAILRVLLGEQGVQRVESIPVRIVDDVQPQFLKGEGGLLIVERLFQARERR